MQMICLAILIRSEPHDDTSIRDKLDKAVLRYAACIAKGTMQVEAARLGLTATHECHRVKRRKEEGEQLIENPLANFVSETKGSTRQSQPAQQPGANGKAERPGYAKV
jgi:hypothetical protein